MSEGVELQDLLVVEVVNLVSGEKMHVLALLGNLLGEILPGVSSVLGKVVTVLIPLGRLSSSNGSLGQCQIHLGQIADVNVVPLALSFLDSESLSSLQEAVDQQRNLHGLGVSRSGTGSVDTRGADDGSVNIAGSGEDEDVDVSVRVAINGEGSDGIAGADISVLEVLSDGLSEKLRLGAVG